MSDNPLDMSSIVKDWTPATEKFRCATFQADGSRPITLDFKAANVNAPTKGKILIMQVRRSGEELWGIRMLPSGRILIQPGTDPSRESLYGYPGELGLGVSFSPATGALSVVTSDGSQTESFNLTSRNTWAEPSGDYEILLGAPETYADLSPIGWRIDCSFRCGPSALSDPPLDERAVLGPDQPWEGDPWAGGSIQDLDTERHWEAMLALASGRHLSAAYNPDEIAREAQALVNAHNAWKEGR